MAMTPYPDSYDRLENPSIRVSDDGAFWTIPAKTRDPIISAPEQSHIHHSDPFILINSDTLYLFYRTTDKIEKKSIISWTSTKDLVNWSHSQEIYHGSWLLSPSIINEGGLWKIWFVDRIDITSTQLMYASGASLEKLSKAIPCKLTLEGYQCWHIEVRKDQGKYHALVSAFPGKKISNRQVLFFIKSLDGMLWDSPRKPVAKPTFFGWDNKLLYKASFHIQGNNVRIWYSASSYGRKWYIGEMVGTLNSLKRISRPPLRRINFLIKYVDDLISFCKLLLGRLL